VSWVSGELTAVRKNEDFQEEETEEEFYLGMRRKKSILFPKGGEKRGYHCLIRKKGQN